MRVDRLSAIAGEFDGVLIDQFGVLHDGRSLYPGALEVLEGLHKTTSFWLSKKCNCS